MSVILFTVTVDQIGFGILFPILPYYSKNLGGDAVVLGLLGASFALMQFLFSPVLGRLSDRYGRRPVLLVALLGSVVGNLLFALANSLPLLFLSRIIGGIGSSKLPVAQAYVADNTEIRDRTKWMGRVGGALGFGFFLGPTIGGTASIYGIAAPGYAAAIISIVNLVLALLFLPESPHLRGLGRERRMFPRSAGFGELLRRPLVGALVVTYFIVAFAFSIIPVVYPLFGIARFNMTATSMSFVFTYVGLTQIVMQGLVLGRLVGWVREEKLLIIGSLILMLSILSMAYVPDELSFMATNGPLSVGIGITNSLVPSMISKRVARGEQGSSLGLAQSVAGLARVPGPLVGGLVFQYLGESAPFLITSGLTFVGLVLTIRVFLNIRNPKPGTDSATENPSL